MKMEFGIKLILALGLCALLLFIFGIIALPIKLVLMLFYPLGDPSVPTQTAAPYWNLSLEAIRWEAYLASAVLFALFFAGSIAVASAFFSKGTGRVFLSYHHSNYAQVIDFAMSLRRSGFDPLFVEFMSAPQHDALLDDIYKKIEVSDFFVCFPGLEPSFVEAEISAAISAKKPIFIILPQCNRGAPNTSQKSYPALILEKLRIEQFASVFAILNYLYGDWRNTIKVFCGSIKVFGTWIENPAWPKLVKIIFHAPFYVLVIAFVGFASLKASEFIAFVLPFIGFEWSDFFVLLQMQFVFVVIIPSFAGTILMWNVGGVLAASWVRWRARLVIRRQIEQGTYSFHSLTKLFDDDLAYFLSAFFKDPPKAHHEVIGAKIDVEGR
jgi:hypothetical protein